MSSSQHCSECGAEITAGKPDGLCTRCLLALGLQAASVPSQTDPLAPADPSLLTPHSSLVTAFGDYVLIEEIARGGMGIVYQARQVSLDRIVAVKLLLTGALSSPEYVKRFRVEASAAASLQHPNIVTIHEVGVHQGQHYLVMDYVDGPSLAKLIAQHPLPANRAAAYLKIVAEAVHFAHEHGILHRDLKPSNVLIDANDQPRVTDFGLAKRFAGESELTLSGQLVGSPSYMPPEQAAAKRGKVSRRSDVYGLGATLYHLLTGRAPFQAATLTDTLDQVLNTEPVAPHLLNPAVPRDLETICLKCLEKEPAKRYPTARALAEELERFLKGQPVLARPIGPTGMVWRWCSRNTRLAAALSAALLSLLLGLAGVTWQWQRAESQRARAETEGLLARRNAYAADMNLVQQALEESDLGRARELLDRHRPQRKLEIRNSKFATDLRGWEWRYFWARCQSEERLLFCHYSNSVSAIAFSADSKWLAVRRIGGDVALWDTAKRRSVTNMWGAGCYKALAFSREGCLLAWGSEDLAGAPIVILRDVDAQKEIARLPHKAKPVSIEFSPDAKEFATLDDTDTVRVWNIATKTVLTNFTEAKTDQLGIRSPGRFTRHYGCLHYSPNGRWLAVGDVKPQIRLLERATGNQRVIPVPESADGISALAFSPDSRLLAAGYGAEDNEVHIWDLAANKELLRLRGHSGWIVSLAFSRDGQTLASASTDQTLRLWDLAGTAEPQPFQGHTDEVWAAAWSPDGNHLATGGKDGSVRYWEPKAKRAAPYAVLTERIFFWGPAFLPDSRTFIAVTYPEGAVARWDAATAQIVEPLPFLGTNHTSVDLSRSGRWLALGDAQGNVRVWDFPERRLVTNLVSSASHVFALIFSPGDTILNCGARLPGGGMVPTFWAVPEWRMFDLPSTDINGLSDLAVSPDERTIAIGYANGTAAWWDLVTGHRHAFFNCQYASLVQVAFSPDAKWFATASADGLITLLDAATRHARPIAREHRNGLADLAFSPDGQRMVATGSSPNGVVKVWDMETGRDVATLPGEPGWYCRIGFSPDGTTFFAVSRGYKALLWRAPSLKKIDAAEKE